MTTDAGSYLMDDPREAGRLAEKVDAPAWVERYFAAHLQGASRVLDVGCGPGVIAAEVAARCPRASVVGVDLSEDRLAEARRRHGGRANLRFERANAAKLPFADESFDLIYCRFLLEYLACRDDAVAEMRRVCRPGAKVILQDLDGQLLWHYPIDPRLEAGLELVIAAMAEGGFDPLIGRKLFHLAKRCGLHPEQVRVDPYHLYAGAIDPRNERLWELKLDIALPAMTAALGDADKAAALKEMFMRHLRDPETLTYSNVFTVVCGRG